MNSINSFIYSQFCRPIASKIEYQLQINTLEKKLSQVCYSPSPYVKWINSAVQLTKTSKTELSILTPWCQASIFMFQVKHKVWVKHFKHLAVFLASQSDCFYDGLHVKWQ